MRNVILSGLFLVLTGCATYKGLIKEQKNSFVIDSSLLQKMSKVSSNEIKKAQKAVNKKVKTETKFKEVRADSKGVVCGKVNKKNSNGLFAGYLDFYYYDTGDKEVLSIEPINTINTFDGDLFNSGHKLWCDND